MDKLSFAYNHISHLGSNIQNLISSLKYGNDEHFAESMNLIINDFDTSFVEIQSLLPYFIQIPQEEQNRVYENVKINFKNKKEKHFNRYQKEIEQYSQRFLTISQNVDNKIQYYNEKIQFLKEEFEEKLKKLDCSFVDSRILQNNNNKEKINEIDEKIESIKEEQKQILEKEEQKIANQYSIQLEQKNHKINEIEKSIKDINKEKEEKTKNSNDRLQKLKLKQAAEMDLLNHQHGIEMDKIAAQEKDVQEEIESVEDRINTLQRRMKYSEFTFQSRIHFAKNSINMDHQLRVKECQRQIADTENKIKNLNKMMEKVEKNADDYIKQNLAIWKKKIDEEIMKRNKKLKQIEEDVKKEYEDHVAEKKERLKQLNYEISENQLKSAQAVAKVTDKLLSRVALVQNKNQDEIDKLKNELERIRHYLSKVQEEWESLRDSTHCIYDHKILELRSLTAIQKAKHENHLNEVIKKNTPVPDTTDYMGMLQDELAQMEEDYKQEESRLSNDKDVQLKIKLDEEHSRGLLSTRKQNLAELNMFKETESHIKAQRDRVDDENRELTRKCQLEIEDFTVTMNHKVNCAINEVVKDLNLKRSKINQDIDSINAQIDKVKEEIEKTKKLTKETKEALSPKAKDEEGEKEVQDLFEEKKSKMQQSIDELRAEVKLLKDTKLNLLNSEKREQSKYETAKSNLDAEKEKYIKEADRGKSEIEYKYKRLIEEQERIFQKMNDNWNDEMNEKRSYKEQLKSEKERVASNSVKNQEKTDNDFRKKASEMRLMKGKEYKSVEDEEALKYNKEEAALLGKIEERRIEYSKIEKYKFQDNQILLRKKNDEYQKELDQLVLTNKKIEDHINELQNKIIQRLEWICPDCEKLETEIKDMKKTILEIVQKIHEMEKEDGNRQFTLAHFGQSTRALPRLKVPDEKADVV